MSATTGLEIAVIGMSGRFPGAADLKMFWNNLKNGVESITFLSDEEMLKEGEDPARIDDPLYVKAGSFIGNKQYFDAAFFNYRPEEAAVMDPQMRILHECVWQAIEDAGYNVNAYKGRIGLFTGASPNLNWESYAMLTNTGEHVDPFTTQFLSNIQFGNTRVSYALNLTGPSVSLNTACSTSLVAIHQACNSLLLGECTMAVAGGITINNHSRKGYLYKEGMIFSKDGHCRAFDADASGTVGSEGVGLVVLKRLKYALAENDNILAVIKGTGINNDGRGKVGYTAPAIDGQCHAIMMAHKMARIPAESISYIETHGTATRLGDPIEIDALNQAFGESNLKYCALGSVKTNIGHADAAAGSAGFIKTVLSLKHKQIPASLNYKNPNPEIDFNNSPFYINTKLKEWERNIYPLRAGVSSFGIGGTNSHVVLEEAPVPEPSNENGSYRLLVFSARTREALERNIGNVKAYLKENANDNLADIAFTLQTGRVPFEYRKMIVCSDATQAIRQLEAEPILKGMAHISKKRMPLVFMFSGQGSQYINMGRDLYKQESAFKKEVDHCFRIIKNISRKDLHNIIFPEDGSQNIKAIDNTEYTQPALFVFEYALARLLMAWGIKPDILIGHSIGEYVAACISGVFSLEDALALVLKRGELMQRTAPGAMLSMSIRENDLKELLVTYDDISLAAVNSSELCVVSGRQVSIDCFRTEIEKRGYKSKLIRTSHAFHSYTMDAILDEFEREVRNISTGSMNIPFISGLTGDYVSAEDVARPAYWVNQLREPVAFSKGIGQLLMKEQMTFVEVGPGKALSTFVRSHQARKSDHKIINIVRHVQESGDDMEFLMKGIGELWLCGIEPDWTGVYGNELRRKVSLPAYSFDQVAYPVHVSAYKVMSEMIAEGQGGRKNNISDWFYIPIWKLSPELGDVISNPVCSLIFASNHIVVDDLIGLFNKKGEKPVSVIAATEYRKLSTRQYEINPGNEAHYTQLFNDLSGDELFPDRIIHSWGIAGIDGESFSDDDCNRCFYSLLFAIKAYKALSRVARKQLILLTGGLHPVLGNEPVAPVKGLAPVLLKILAQEFPAMRVTSIDVNNMEQPVTDTMEEIYRQIHDSGSGKIISFRHGRKWEQAFEKINCNSFDKGKEPFRQGGVYLITGGLGDLGFNLAHYLLKEFGANVVLTGRTPLPPASEWTKSLEDATAEKCIKDRIKRMRQLENEGGRVMYYDCDICDQERMTDVVKLTEERFGNIHGVIHAAGIVIEKKVNTVPELARDEYEKEFHPKIKGLENLVSVLGRKELDFCIITSSLSAILGGWGMGAYAPANSYMDYFISSHRRKGNLKNWVCVNLDSLVFDGHRSEGIKKDELADVLKWAVRLKSFPQVIVSVSDLEKRLRQWVYRHEASNEKNGNDKVIGVVKLHGENTNGSMNNISNAMLLLWKDFFGRPGLTLDDDFFEAGGDSLKALTMIGRIHKMFNVEIPIKEFFNRPSITALSEYIEKLSKTSDYVPIPKAAVMQAYPLSSAQKRLYFLYESDKNSLAYNLPQVIELEGVLDIEKLNRVFRLLLERHEVFRSFFTTADNEIVQKITSAADFNVSFFQADEKEVNAIIKEFIQPFDLGSPPLIRVALIECSSVKHFLVTDIHHIIMDGFSQGILVKDFMALYNGKELAPPALQYKDFSIWEQSATHKAEIKRSREFWMNEFSGELPLLNLPVDFPRPVIKDYTGNTLHFYIEERELNALKSIAQGEGVSMFMLTLSVYTILLGKLAGQDDVIVGTNTTGRYHPDTQDILGMFVNTLALRNRPAENLIFRDFLHEVKAGTLAAFESQAYQYEALIDDLKIERDLSRNPLFDAMFVFQNLDDPQLEMQGVKLTPHEFHAAVSKFDLSLIVFDMKDKLKLTFEYAASLYRQETIEGFIAYFSSIVSSIADDVHCKISGL